MICPKCNVEMVLGEVIDPKSSENSRYIVPQAPLNIYTLEVIPCWKCPNCGHSEYLEDLKFE